MFRMDRHGQCLQKREYLRPVFEVPARKFSRNERMAGNMAFVQKRFKPGVPIPQMRHPY
jgi:hypothetical protein